MSSPTPVIFDDGSKAMVPPEKLSAALKDGGKVAQAMQFDDGSKAYVTLDRVHDAIHDGGMLMGAPPPKPAMAPVPSAQPMNWFDQRRAQTAENAVEAGKHVADIGKNVANDTYDVSAFNIADQIHKRLRGQPNTLDQIPPKAVVAFLAAGGVPEAEEGEAAAKGASAAAEPAASEIPKPAASPSIPQRALPPAQEATPAAMIPQPSSSVSVPPRYQPSAPQPALDGPPPMSARDTVSALKQSLKDLGGEFKGQLKPKVIQNGHTYEYDGVFRRDGKILDDADGIVEATDALSTSDPHHSLGPMIEQPLKFSDAPPRALPTSEIPKPASPYGEPVAPGQAVPESDPLLKRLRDIAAKIEKKEKRATTKAGAEPAEPDFNEDLTPLLMEHLRMIEAQKAAQSAVNQ